MKKHSRRREKKSKRRWPFLLAVAVVVVCVFFAARHRRRQSWDRAVKFIVDAGGEVTYDLKKFSVRELTFALPVDAQDIDEAESSYRVSRHNLPIGVVCLSEIQVTPEVMRAVACLPKIRSLDLYKAKYGDEAWGVLMKVNNVESLWLGGKDNTPEHMSQLHYLNEMKELSIWESRLSETSCHAIASLPELEYLGLECVEISDEGVAELARVSAPISLTLEWSRGESPLTEKGLAQLANISALRSLELRWPEGESRLSGEGVRFLRNLAELESLTLTDCPINNDDLRHISGLQRLNYLVLNGILIDNKALDHITRITSLKILGLFRTNITGNVPDRFERLVNLRDIRFGETPIDDDALKHLYSLPQLTSVLFRETHVTQDGIQALKNALPDIHIFEYPDDF